MKFFKVLLSDFETELWLPPHFCTRTSQDFSPEAVVKTRLGRWKIDVGESSGKFYFHGDQWDGFVKGHKLSVGDFIVFEHHGSMHFDALIFDPSACEKEFSTNQLILRNAVQTPLQHGTTNSCLNPTFRKTIKATSSSDYFSPLLARLYIPMKIWRAINLHQKEDAILKIPGSLRVWPVKLRHYKDGLQRPGYERLAMTRGWYEFCCFNKIKKGDECIFEIMNTDADDVVKIVVTIVPK